MDYLKCGDLANITEFFDEAKAKEYRDAAILHNRQCSLRTWRIWSERF